MVKQAIVTLVGIGQREFKLTVRRQLDDQCIIVGLGLVKVALD